VKYRYTKYTGNLLDEIDLEDLVSKLSDLLLSSGFSNPWGGQYDNDEDRTMQALHDAILEALFTGGASDEAVQQPRANLLTAIRNKRVNNSMTWSRRSSSE
jgi:hypothetical protein